MLQRLDSGEGVPTELSDYPVQTWAFGNDLAMVFLAGEVVQDYSIRMSDMFDANRLWVNAYCNDVPCYIPSKRVLREGGYEGGGATSTALHIQARGRSRWRNACWIGDCSQSTIDLFTGKPCPKNSSC